MDKLGILKEFDKLGRIVVPKELRDRYMLNDKVEIVATKEGVLIKNQEYFLEKRNPTNENEDRQQEDIKSG